MVEEASHNWNGIKEGSSGSCDYQEKIDLPSPYEERLTIFEEIHTNL